MKRTITLIMATAILGIYSSHAQLFPKVDKPTSDNASMLAVQFGHENDGKYESVANLNFSGWVPAVKGPNGEEVAFRNFDSGAKFTNIYYAENLAAGEYTLVGWHHIYTDYSKLDAHKAATGEKLARWAPFENLPYHVKQLIPLTEPVVVNLEPNKIMSLGSYAVVYKWIGGAAGTTDDRWKVDEEFTKIVKSNPADDTVIRYMKTWATPTWKKWNAKNLATPL